MTVGDSPIPPRSPCDVARAAQCKTYTQTSDFLLDVHTICNAALQQAAGKAAFTGRQLRAAL